MATPIMKVNNINMTVTKTQPASFFFPTKDANGTTINVSTGYSDQPITSQVSSNPNGSAGSINLTGQYTATFSTTGVTISWTGAQASAIASLLPSTNNTFLLAISNDAGVTETILGTGSLNVNNYGGNAA